MTPGGGGIIRRFGRFLPVGPDTPVVSLAEGDTPLLYSERLSEETSADVWLKWEGLNPTGSFKDRGMTIAVSKAVEEGSGAVLCASTGNTSASAAAYAARAGIVCGVLVPRGQVAVGKLAQAVVHGARVLEVEGSFDVALELTKEIASRHPVTLVNSVNPFRIEGQKTAAFEIVEALGAGPDVHVMPVGNAGNITAYWKGYTEAVGEGLAETRPKMFGFQAAGADPIVRGRPVSHPETVATAIRIGNPASWDGANRAASESGGAIASVTDEEIMAAYDALAREGVFAEPASAASVAGLRRLSAADDIPPRASVVCVLTGSGLKDPDVALHRGIPTTKVPPDVGSVVAALGF
ncbi:MAG TPA: threonine synthase [Actinomycetota bacterium]|nr:threonine synthase [Actinomycetota bacterium]